jgi:hypothetical protein
VAYDCSQTVACLETSRGPAPPGTVDNCVSQTSASYAKLPSSSRAQVDSTFHSCSGRKACDYFTCVRGASGDESISPPEPCSGITKPVSGTVTSSVGAFAYSNAEARFWVNDESCLTTIDLELTSGPCSLTFTGEGLLDAQNRYLITRVQLDARGLCPGYPDGLGNPIVVQSATSQPFGTIELQREEASWLECRPGTLVVTPSVVLSNPGGPAIDLNGAQIKVSGNFAKTHLDPSGGCPVPFN